MKFTGTKNYVSTEDLSMAVNATIALERPLIIKGEPGTGKTLLAIEVAESLGMELIEWHVKSTTKASQGLYEYDAVTRLRDSQLGDERVKDIKNYIKKGKLWEAFESEKQVVLLSDEIDKADIEFPNDLLQELDRMEFYCYETGETIKAKKRPLIIITSNNEKELPDAFLRRCFFHYIQFPDRSTMEGIVKVHYPNIKKALVKDALDLFFDVRKMNNNLYFNELFNQNGISLIKIKDKDFQNFLDFPILIHHKKKQLVNYLFNNGLEVRTHFYSNCERIFNNNLNNNSETY